MHSVGVAIYLPSDRDLGKPERTRIERIGEITRFLRNQKERLGVETTVWSGAATVVRSGRKTWGRLWYRCQERRSADGGWGTAVYGHRKVMQDRQGPPERVTLANWASDEHLAKFLFSRLAGLEKTGRSGRESCGESRHC